MFAAMQPPDPQWELDDARADDGIRGPAGDVFRPALRDAALQLGVAAAAEEPLGGWLEHAPWIDEQWRGRWLTIGPSTYGAQGRTTGCRWVVIRLFTTTRLGVWAEPGGRSISPLEGVGLPVTPLAVGPAGTWADDPPISDALWAFAERLLPHRHPSEQPRFAVLQVREDAVLWQMRLSRLDREAIVDAVELLGRVADYAERHDGALSARLGRPKGVTTIRRIELAVIAFVVGGILAIIGGMFALDALF